MTTEFETNAKYIAHRLRDWNLREKMPSVKGWKYLGSGCSRAAYLGPDGFVYKVDCDESWAGDNITEFTKYCLAKKHEKEVIPGHIVRLTPCDLYFTDDGAVLVMEYVKGRRIGDCLKFITLKCTCQTKRTRLPMCQNLFWMKVNKAFGILDAHNYNVVKEGDVWYILDYAF